MSVSVTLGLLRNRYNPSNSLSEFTICGKPAPGLDDAMLAMRCSRLVRRPSPSRAPENSTEISSPNHSADEFISVDRSHLSSLHNKMCGIMSPAAPGLVLGALRTPAAAAEPE